MEPQNEKEKGEEGKPKKKLSESFENLKKHERIEDLYKYAKSNTADTIAYVAMLVGILTLFFEPVYGGLIIGIVTGLYFSNEIMVPIRNIEGFIEDLGMVRSIVFGGLLLAFLIQAFWIYVGAAIGVAIKLVIAPKITD